MQMLDQEGQEWDEGCTKECKLRPFDTPTASLTIIDAPGKPEFQRATVSGLSGVDAIILVVDATEGVNLFLQRLSSRPCFTCGHAHL